MGRLSVDEWLNEMDRMDEDNLKKERRHTGINDSNIKELEKSRKRAKRQEREPTGIYV